MLVPHSALQKDPWRSCCSKNRSLRVLYGWVVSICTDKESCRQAQPELGSTRGRLQCEMVRAVLPSHQHQHNSLYSWPTCGGDASEPVPQRGVVHGDHWHQVLGVWGQVGQLQRVLCSLQNHLQTQGMAVKPMEQLNWPSLATVASPWQVCAQKCEVLCALC